MREARELYELINKKIGKKGGLYRLGVGYSDVTTYDNALMGILCLGLGKRKEAEELYELINKKIGKKGGLYRWEPGHPDVATFGNALMAILCCLLGRKVME
jgi:hypothetical protein